MVDLLAGFARWQTERGLVPDVIRRRDRLLCQLARCAGGDLLAVDAETVRGFLAGRRISAASRRVLLSSLHAFYAWAVAEGRTDHDPTMRIPRPRLGPRLPRPMGEDDYALAVAMAADPRLRALLLLAGMAGLRCCELARLAWADVDMVAGVIQIIGKGDKHRVGYLHPAVIAALSDVPRDSAWIAGTSPRGGRRSPAGLSQQLNGHLHRHGVVATAHQLRHRAATQGYANNGGDLLALQQFLGHASVSTTQIYTRVANAAVRATAHGVPTPTAAKVMQPQTSAARPALPPPGRTERRARGAARPGKPHGASAAAAGRRCGLGGRRSTPAAASVETLAILVAAIDAAQHPGPHDGHEHGRRGDPDHGADQMVSGDGQRARHRPS